MSCPHCGAPLSADARFCGVCGKAASPTESDAGIPLAQVAELAGKEIAGRYRILTKLGEGGMGAVYRGEQISLRRTVAVKLLRPELSANQTLLRRFSAEAEAVAKLSHPNTVNVYDFGQDTDGSLFIAMEYIEGRSLRSVVAKEGPLAPARALHIAAQVAASLADAHAHAIVHRDLKPDNVMLQERGRQRDVVRVLDFGIAKLRDDSRGTQAAMTQAGDMLGTPQYMAPEQIKGDPVDGRCDIYALGCMIYEMVTGRLPFEAPTIMAMLTKHLIEAPVPPTQRRPDLALPPAIDALVLAAMAKDPAQRPASMEQYGEDIAAVLATLPAATAPVTAQASAAHPVAGMVTPAAPSAFAPPPQTPAPAPAAAAYVSAQIPPTMHAPPAGAPAPRARRAGLFVVLGIVVLGGGGMTAYVATRSHDGPEPGSGSARAVEPPPAPADAASAADDPWNKPAPAPAAPDPWNAGASPTPPATPASRPHAATSPTSEMPLPKGARLVVPSDWTSVDNAQGIGYVDPSRTVFVGMGPLAGGTNDPSELARMWENTTGAKLTGMQKLKSAGAMRDAAGFTTTINGVVVAQIIVAYISSRYRVGVIFQLPVERLTDQAAQQQIEQFFERDVVLPD